MPECGDAVMECENKWTDIIIAANPTPSHFPIGKLTEQVFYIFAAQALHK